MRRARRRVHTAAALAVALGAADCRAPEGPAATAAPRLVAEKVLVDGRLVQVAHSHWDMGGTADLFDSDPATMARTENANPAFLEFRLPKPRPLKGLSLTMGGRDFAVTATVLPEGAAPRTYTREFRQMPQDPTLELDFDTGEARIESLRVVIFDLNAEDGRVHIRTVRLI